MISLTLNNLGTPGPCAPIRSGLKTLVAIAHEVVARIAKRAISSTED